MVVLGRDRFLVANISGLAAGLSCRYQPLWCKLTNTCSWFVDLAAIHVTHFESFRELTSSVVGPERRLSPGKREFRPIDNYTRCQQFV